MYEYAWGFCNTHTMLASVCACAIRRYYLTIIVQE
jgi:hypothetical protein